MKTIQVTREIYRYEELSEEVKQDLRDAYRESWPNYLLATNVKTTWSRKLDELGYGFSRVYWDLSSGGGAGCTVFESDKVRLREVVARMNDSEATEMAEHLIGHYWEAEIHCDLKQTWMGLHWLSNAIPDLAFELDRPCEEVQLVVDRIHDFIRADAYAQAKIIHKWIVDRWSAICDDETIDNAFIEDEGWYYEDGEEYEGYEEDDDAIDA